MGHTLTVLLCPERSPHAALSFLDHRQPCLDLRPSSFLADCQTQGFEPQDLIFAWSGSAHYRGFLRVLEELSDLKNELLENTLQAQLILIEFPLSEKRFSMGERGLKRRKAFETVIKRIYWALLVHASARPGPTPPNLARSTEMWATAEEPELVTERGHWWWKGKQQGMIQAHLNMGDGNSAESRPWKGLEKGICVPAKSVWWGCTQQSRNETWENRDWVRQEEPDQGWGTELIDSFSLPGVAQKAKRKHICVLLCYDIGSRDPFTWDQCRP